MAIAKIDRPRARAAFVAPNLDDPATSRAVDGLDADGARTRKRVAALETAATMFMTGPSLPNLAVAAAQGTVYIRVAGDASSLWFKQTTTGNTGWVQVTVP